jgi:hypothetical protein
VEHVGHVAAGSKTGRADVRGCGVGVGEKGGAVVAGDRVVGESVEHSHEGLGVHRLERTARDEVEQSAERIAIEIDVGAAIDLGGGEAVLVSWARGGRRRGKPANSREAAEDGTTDAEHHDGLGGGDELEVVRAGVVWVHAHDEGAGEKERACQRGGVSEVARRNVRVSEKEPSDEAEE